jgi:hypothetical protein
VEADRMKDFVIFDIQYSFMIRYLIIIGALIVCTINTYAKQTVLNNNRAGLKWQQINTADFKIIYPNGFESEAQRMANTMQLLHDPIDKSLQTNTRKATIILQNQNSVANGFVTLGPRRSEFYTSAPQSYNFLGTNDWLNTLAVHEYRHLVQFNKSRTGFNKLFYYLFGQNTQAAMASISTPQWFWEGDAVAAETAFTQSGRGRIPAFNRIFRANLLEGKRYNYNKQSLRSYKDFVPNHYVLGYHMISHIRKESDNGDIFAEVAKRTWDVPFIPFAFSSALKKKTGEYVVKHYDNMMTDLGQQWQAQLDKVNPTTFGKITVRSNSTFTNYAFPSQMANGKIFSLKSGIGDIQQFVMVGSDGHEEVMFTPGRMNNSGMISITGNTVAWNEFSFDPRWGNQSYSVIKLYNQDTDQLKVLTKKSRYHGASLSPDGRQVATVESMQDGKYRLVILDTSSGAVVKHFENQTEGLLTLPSWSSDGATIVFLSNYAEKKSVQAIDLSSGVESILVAAGVENIGNPRLIDDRLYYQSDYSGIDNIYALDLKSKERFQITSSKYGAYNFSLSNDKKSIYYNDHSVDGLDIVHMDFEPSNWRPLGVVEQNTIGYADMLSTQESHPHILDSIPKVVYETRKYSKLKGLINPHSWGPFVNTDDLNQVQVGVFSQDQLGTTSVYAGYDYNQDRKDGALVGRVSYQGFYPILDFEFAKGKRSDGASTWDEQTIEYGARIPLVLTKSKYHTELTIGNSIGHREVSNYENGFNDLGRLIDYETTVQDTIDVRVRGVDIAELDNGSLLFNNFNITYFHLLKRSVRDINSRFGQVLVLENFNAFSGDYIGSLTALRAVFYFPGLKKHHSFYLRGGIQSRKVVNEPNLYAFGNRAFRPRGYDSYPLEKNSSIAQFNYAMPLLYPDVALGPFFNVKRVKVNMFADFGKSNTVNYLRVTRLDDPSVGGVQDTPIIANFTSFGAELTVDFNIMRALPELELGVRFSYISSNVYFDAGNKIELIIGNISF